MSYVTIEARQVVPDDYVYNSTARKLPAAFHWVRVTDVSTQGCRTSIRTTAFETVKHPREAIAVRRLTRSK